VARAVHATPVAAERRRHLSPPPSKRHRGETLHENVNYEGTGILLDPVCTGKGAHGLLELAGESAFPPSGDVVFLHTGGLPGLFGYPETMTPEGDPA